MSLARHNLLQDKIRLALSIAGVALAIMLILLLNGLLDGTNRQVSAYLDRTPGTLVVAQAGVHNLLGATSILPAGARAAVRGVPGVEAAVPILSQFVILDLHGKKQPIYLVGYDPAIGGGPWQLATGRQPAAADEVVFDQVLAQRHGIMQGDRVAILDRTFRVSGLSSGTTSWMTSFVFVRTSAMETVLRTPGATSFLLVQPAGDGSARALRDRLDALPGMDALTKDQMMANDLRLFARVFSGPLRLMVGIAFLVGTLVIGLVSYTAVVERQREYGVLKALGARNRLLYRVVAVQALLAAIVGAAGGGMLALAAARLIMTLRPQFLVVLAPTMLAQALTVGVAMALLAALVPARTVARLAPADVFRR